jgi:hypothetical protein
MDSTVGTQGKSWVFFILHWIVEDKEDDKHEEKEEQEADVSAIGMFVERSLQLSASFIPYIFGAFRVVVKRQKARQK